MQQADTPIPKGVRVCAAGPAPLFELADLDSNRQLADARGHWVFVHFWASWCGPCRKEMPAFQRLARLLADESLSIVMINTARDEDTVFEFMGIVAPGMNSLMDAAIQVTKAWQPHALPAPLAWSTHRDRSAIRPLGGRPRDQPAYLTFLCGLSSA